MLHLDVFTDCLQTELWGHSNSLAAVVSFTCVTLFGSTQITLLGHCGTAPTVFLLFYRNKKIILFSWTTNATIVNGRHLLCSIQHRLQSRSTVQRVLLFVAILKTSLLINHTLQCCLVRSEVNFSKHKVGNRVQWWPGISLNLSVDLLLLHVPPFPFLASDSNGC